MGEKVTTFDMANRRMIYDSFYANADLNMLSIHTRHLYLGTIVLADDDGKLSAESRYLKGRLFPCDEEITSNDVQKMLEKLNDISQIILYEVGGRQFIKHPNWKKYQHIRKDLHRNSTVPNPLRSRNESVTPQLLNQDNQDKQINQVKEDTPHEISQSFFSNPSKQESVISELVAAGVPEDVARREMGKFVEYWTEKNKSGTKQRWEGEKTFEVNLRLKRWFRNINQFQNKSIGRELKIISY